MACSKGHHKKSRVVLQQYTIHDLKNCLNCLQKRMHNHWPKGHLHTPLDISLVHRWAPRKFKYLATLINMKQVVIGLLHNTRICCMQHHTNSTFASLWELHNVRSHLLKNVTMSPFIPTKGKTKCSYFNHDDLATFSHYKPKNPQPMKPLCVLKLSQNPITLYLELEFYAENSDVLLAGPWLF